MVKKIVRKLNTPLLIPILYIAVIFYITIFFGYPTEYTIKNKFTITCEEDTNIRLFQFIPTSYGYQNISNIKVTPNKDYTINDTGKISILRMECTLEKGTNNIDIDFDAKLEKGKVTWNSDPMPNKAFKNDETDQLYDIANSITDRTSTKDAVTIHNFVVKHMSWDKSRNRINERVRNALEVYNEPVGVCEDYATLMVGLLNSNGIPARKITGLSLPKLFNEKEPATWLHQAGSHAWVEFYADDYWHVSDPSWGNKCANYSDGLHLSFGDAEQFNKIYNNEVQWLEENLKLNAAMRLPLMFGISSPSGKLKIVPIGKVKIKYNINYLYLLPLLAYIIIVIIVIIVRKYKEKSL